MAGKRDELAELRARIAQLELRNSHLEQEIQGLHAATAQARPLLDDTDRLASLAAEARRQNESTAAAVETMRGLTAAAGIGQPRFEAKFGMIYQTTTTGYVSVNFGITESLVSVGLGMSGYATDIVTILVGTSSPPTQLVAKTNSRNHECDYAGAIIRAGEYWVALAEHGGAAYRCIFTPLT
jgi:uncharacterized coiled-coil protein SlyX